MNKNRFEEHPLHKGYVDVRNGYECCFERMLSIASVAHPEFMIKLVYCEDGYPEILVYRTRSGTYHTASEEDYILIKEVETLDEAKKIIPELAGKTWKPLPRLSTCHPVNLLISGNHSLDIIIIDNDQFTEMEYVIYDPNGNPVIHKKEEINLSFIEQLIDSEEALNDLLKKPSYDTKELFTRPDEYIELSRESPEMVLAEISKIGDGGVARLVVCETYELFLKKKIVERVRNFRGIKVDPCDSSAGNTVANEVEFDLVAKHISSAIYDSAKEVSLDLDGIKSLVKTINDDDINVNAILCKCDGGDNWIEKLGEDRPHKAMRRERNAQWDCDIPF